MLEKRSLKLIIQSRTIRKLSVYELLPSDTVRRILCLPVCGGSGPVTGPHQSMASTD